MVLHGCGCVLKFHCAMQTEHIGAFSIPPPAASISSRRETGRRPGTTAEAVPPLLPTKHGHRHLTRRSQSFFVNRGHHRHIVSGLSPTMRHFREYRWMESIPMQDFLYLAMTGALKGEYEIPRHWS